MKLKIPLIIFVLIISFLLIFYFSSTQQKKKINNDIHQHDKKKQMKKKSDLTHLNTKPFKKKDLIDSPKKVNLTKVNINSDSLKLLVDEAAILPGELVTHQAYAFYYSEFHEQPYWVKYILTKSMLENPTCKRKNNFRSDPKVSTFSASLEDYSGSGYDRGHLCPAKDMEYSKEAMSQSFFMSNMSPQHPSLNRGRWKSLESKVRQWSLSHDSLIIYCGGILDSINLKIGPNNVSVPKYYYKVVFSIHKKKAIAFIMPNKKCDYDLIDYAVSVDSVESLIHFDLFDNLSPEIQKTFESESDIKFWFRN
jgi:endonuclease G